MFVGIEANDVCAKALWGLTSMNVQELTGDRSIGARRCPSNNSRSARRRASLKWRMGSGPASAQTAGRTSRTPPVRPSGVPGPSVTLQPFAPVLEIGQSAVIRAKKQKKTSISAALKRIGLTPPQVRVAGGSQAMAAGCSSNLTRRRASMVCLVRTVSYRG